ncbi:MAG: hypothetical protein PHD55_09695, partial [Methanoregula sp.]|nr:hypothetical protein [Methanoregula sp.]
ASPPPSPAIYPPPYKIPSLQPPTTPPISRIQPSQNRLKLDDDRKIRHIRPDLSVRALDWTVKNPVPTFASVFGTGKTPKLDIKLPEFKL